MLRPIDLNDGEVAGRVVEIQRAAYQLEADLIGFDGIPPLHETVTDLQHHQLNWLGAFDDGVLAGVIGWTIAISYRRPRRPSKLTWGSGPGWTLRVGRLLVADADRKGETHQTRSRYRRLKT